MFVESDDVYSNVVGRPFTACGAPQHLSGRPFTACQTEDCSSGDCQTADCQTCDTGCPDFYFSVFGGFSDLQDLTGASGNRQIYTGNGGGVGVALGRRNGRNLRTELEFSYRHNNIDALQIFPNPTPSNAPVDGGLNSYAGMANAYWEFTDAPWRCFKPYIGAGIGVVGIDAIIRDPLGMDIVSTGNGSDSSFAYQWMAGLNYKAYRNMDLFAEYRFFQADSYRIDPAVTGVGDSYDFKTDNVLFGLRWKF